MSGLCGGTYCCGQAAAEAGCTNPCDNTGACSDKAGAVGEACSDTNDCFDGKACLGGRCCEFTQSTYTDDYTGNAYARCASCADTSGERPGICDACAEGFYMLDTSVNIQADGTLIDDPIYQIGSSAACYEPCGADEYINGMSGLYCQSKNQAGSGCHWVNNNNLDRGLFCLSGLCGGTYCCGQAAADAGCTNPCDNTGACSDKAAAGEACSDTNDCFDGKACLGGRCCEFTQSTVHRYYSGSICQVRKLR